MSDERCALCGFPLDERAVELSGGRFCRDSDGCRRRALRLRRGLEILADPKHVPQTEEGAAVMISVQAAARAALAPPPSPRRWTEDQVANAMRYGVCDVCGAPREQWAWTDDDGHHLGIVCPNGHPF